jgi:hypothetical protein
MKMGEITDSLLVNLALLREFKVPKSICELASSGERGRSGLHNQVMKLADRGLIVWSFNLTKVREVGGTTQKFYAISKSGQRFLELFGEIDDHLLVTKGPSSTKFLKINLSLLRRFEEPTNIFDLFSSGLYCSYSDAWCNVKKLLNLELIAFGYLGKTKKMGSPVKKFYVLSGKGKELLGLFPEDPEDFEEDLL